MNKLLLLFFIIITVTLCVDPGIKITITDKGLDYAQQVGIKILLERLGTIVVPDQSGSSHVAVVGTIDWSLSNIKLGSINFPQNKALPVEGKGLELIIDSASLAATADWHFKEKHWPHVSGHGSVDVSLSGVDINVIIGFGEKDGEPTCTVVSETINVNHVGIHVHGGPSWLYNFLLGLFKGNIKHSITDALINGIKDGISNGLNNALMRVPVRQKLDGDIVVIDYSLTDAPRFANNYIVVDGKGEFFDLKNPQEAPYKAGPLPDLVSDRMVQVAVSDYLDNTAGFAFWKAGALTFHITSDQIPASSPLQFNTDSFKYIVPELYQKYPSKNMSATIEPKTSPTGKFDEKGAQIIAAVLVEMFVEDPDDVPVFTIQVDIEADGKALINDKLLYGNITDANFKLTLVSTKIGTFDVTALSSFAEFLFEGVIIPFANTIINKGITIPTIPHIDFVDPIITYGQDYLIVSTNVKYTAAVSTPSPCFYTTE